MALRLLEVTLPNEEIPRVPDLIGDIPTHHLWISVPGAGVSLVRILLDAQNVEALSDALVGRLGTQAGFRLIVLPVEASLPAVEAPEKPQADPALKKESSNGKPLRVSRDELYADLTEASSLTRVYLVMVALSTVVAAVGLIRGDVAIIIGAMVIAPLLGPNITLSLACTLGDMGLARRALKAIGAGVLTAAVLSFILGAAIQFDPTISEIAQRTRASFSDIVLALSAGAAGALAFTGGVPAVVVGVMVAVALLPPLVTAGLLMGAGAYGLAAGALMLLLTNVTCVNLAGVATFLLQKVRPRTWWEARRAKKATRIAVTTWIIMLVLLLGLMFLRRIGA